MASLAKLKTIFAKNFSFTPEERTIVALLCTAFIVGLFLQQHTRRGSREYAEYVYDYSSFTEEFHDVYARIHEKTPADSAEIAAINTITAEQLESVPSIGPKLAQRILDFREYNGSIVSMDDLLSVPGIGPKRLAAIKQYLARVKKN